jgi:N-acetylneuraminate synthase/sialic acid synthase
MARIFRIADFTISDESVPFVIAEVGHNHQGSVQLCENIFDAAADSGVNAVKLQKRFNRTLYTPDFFDSPYQGPTSFGSTYGLHREALEFGESEYRHLQKYADKKGLVFFATAFDFKSVDFLANLRVPAMKIASGDLRSIPLLRYAKRTGIPLIMSTGGSTILDIDQAMAEVDARSVGLLQCTAAYPAEAENMDLRVIETLRKRFPDTVIGLSSHDRGIAFSTVAAALGARIIEKHFTLDRSMKGTDHAFSLEPTGMSKLVRDLSLVVKALGDGEKKFYEVEKDGIRKMGKMLVYSQLLKTGHVISSVDLEIRSPHDGVSASVWDEVIGKRLNRDVAALEHLSLDHLT